MNSLLVSADRITNADAAVASATTALEVARRKLSDASAARIAWKERFEEAPERAKPEDAERLTVAVTSAESAVRLAELGISRARDYRAEVSNQHARLHDSKRAVATYDSAVGRAIAADRILTEILYDSVARLTEGIAALQPLVTAAGEAFVLLPPEVRRGLEAPQLGLFWSGVNTHDRTALASLIARLVAGS